MASAFPAVRACIFDVDGTLIDSEDIYTDIYNSILREYGKPDYPWGIKATQQSRGTSGTLRLLRWAQVPLSVPEWKAKEKAHTQLFKHSKLLPGVSTLLSTLSSMTTNPPSSVKLALASSAGGHLFTLKTSHLPLISEAFTEPTLQVFGDDPEMKDCEKKPAPDIFLLALKRVNQVVAREGGREVRKEECLVFEDSIAGVEAARRAGMRVVWVPHPGLAKVCKGREMDVLMGRTEKNGVPEFSEGNGSNEDEGLELGPYEDMISEDGWAEMRESLTDFPYKTYGIQV